MDLLTSPFSRTTSRGISLYVRSFTYLPSVVMIFFSLTSVTIESTMTLHSSSVLFSAVDQNSHEPHSLSEQSSRIYIFFSLKSFICLLITLSDKVFSQDVQ